MGAPAPSCETVMDPVKPSRTISVGMQPLAHGSSQPAAAHTLKAFGRAARSRVTSAGARPPW